VPAVARIGDDQHLTAGGHHQRVVAGGLWFEGYGGPSGCAPRSAPAPTVPGRRRTTAPGGCRRAPTSTTEARARLRTHRSWRIGAAPDDGYVPDMTRGHDPDRVDPSKQSGPVHS